MQVTETLESAHLAPPDQPESFLPALRRFLAERLQATTGLLPEFRAALAQHSPDEPFVGELATLEKTRIEPWLDALSQGGVHIVRDAAGSVRALAAVRKTFSSHLHETHLEFHYVCAPTDDENAEVACTALRFANEAQELEKRENCNAWFGAVPRESVAAIARLLKCGFFVDSVTLWGLVSDARKGLGLSVEEAQDRLAQDGLFLRPLRSEEEKDAVIALQEQEFTRRPQFGWFLARPGVLADLRTELDSALWQVVASLGAPHRILGAIGSDFTPTQSVGLQAGMSALLDGSLQGKGLATALYALHLKALEEQGVRGLYGGTSQPGVLALSARMGRVVRQVHVRRGPNPFPPDHFEPYLSAHEFR